MKNPLGKQESDARALTEQIEEEAERLARQVSVSPEAVGARVLEQDAGIIGANSRVNQTAQLMRAGRLGLQQVNLAESAYVDRVEADLARGNVEQMQNGLPSSELGSAKGGLESMPVEPELVGAELRSSAERGALAGEELARDEIELNDPLAYVGTDTPGQMGQRIEEDLADLHTEDGTGLPLENQVTKQATAKIVQGVADSVDDLMRRGSFRIEDLQRIYRTGSEQQRRVFGRPLGGRN